MSKCCTKFVIFKIYMYAFFFYINQSKSNTVPRAVCLERSSPTKENKGLKCKCILIFHKMYFNCVPKSAIANIVYILLSMWFRLYY